MSTYLRVAKITIDETVEYRLNFVIWRVRNMFQLLATYFFWSAVVPPQTQFAGYNRVMLLTYMIGASFLNSIVFTSRSNAVGNMINSGDLSNFLIRPFNFFAYWIARDAGDKLMNIGFAVVEYTLFFLLFHPQVFIQTNLISILLFVCAVCFAVAISFLFNCILGFIAFWSPEVWAPRFIFTVIITFFAGGFFPLNILPSFWYTVLMLTPFPYMQYFPMQVYIGNNTGGNLLFGMCVSIVWLFILWKIVTAIWHKGLKVYAAEGK